MKKAITFDDVQLVPKYSEVMSRSNVILKTSITRNYKLQIPIVVAPMDTVCGSKMAKTIMDFGGAGVLHRFCSIEEQSQMVKEVYEYRKENHDEVGDIFPIIAAIGANGDYYERAIELIRQGCNILVIDVAHGHHLNVKNAIKRLKSAIPSFVDIIGGNVATEQSAIDLEQWGADGLRVGIGGGSLCTTRIKTGFGIPNLTAIEETTRSSNIPIMIDGGIRTSGDIAKSLALGADCVMIGSLLAGTDQTPSEFIIDKNGRKYKGYRGLASLETKQTHNQKQNHVEGESTLVKYKGDAEDIINGLLDGVRSALSYGGSTNLSEFRTKSEFVQITSAGVSEAKPHLLH